MLQCYCECFSIELSPAAFKKLAGLTAKGEFLRALDEQYLSPLSDKIIIK